MRDINRIANALERIADALTDKVEQKPTLTVATPPEIPPEIPPEPKQTRDELEKAVRKGLYAFQNRGGSPRALTFAILGKELKTLEMDEEQLIAVLNHKEVQ